VGQRDLPELRASAQTMRRCEARRISFLISVSGRLTLVTPASTSTPLQPMKAVPALMECPRTRPASGSTSECCFGRSVPPVTTTVRRGSAASSASAIVSELVKT
jgi:hypothetical protein